MSEKKEYPELRKELNRLVELQQQNQLTNDADKLIVELTSVLQSTPCPALQDAVKDIAFPVKFHDEMLFITDAKNKVIITFANVLMTVEDQSTLGHYLTHCINKLNS